MASSGLATGVLDLNNSGEIRRRPSTGQLVTFCQIDF